MSIIRGVLSGIVFAAFAAAVFAAEETSGQKNAPAEKPAAQTAAAAGAEQTAPPEKPAAQAAAAAGAEQTAPPEKPAAPAAKAAVAEQNVPPAKPAAAPDAKYAKVTEKNIFYPRHESVVQPGEAGAEVNPGGSSLRLTGVVRSGRRTFAVIENSSTGESSIVSRGESTGAGEVVEATLDGITLMSESGTFRIPVGYFLSGVKGPDTVPAAKAGETAANQPPGAPASTGQAPAAGSNSPSGDSGGRSGGFGGGGRRRPTQEQMDAFNKMTPEDRQRLRDSFRQGRGRRPNNGDAKQ